MILRESTTIHVTPREPHANPGGRAQFSLSSGAMAFAFLSTPRRTRSALRLGIIVVLCAPSAHGTSQGSQDALLKKIFHAVGTTNRYFVEFGFNAPSFEEGSGANTQELWKQGWRGLLLDGGRSNATINLVQTYIKSTNIVHTFQENGVPIELDYLSVDIDSADLWVLRSILSIYRPRVMTVEFNSNYDFHGPHASAITFHDPSTMPTLNGRASWNGTCFFGTSARAILSVASAHNYELVASEAPLDVFFVRSDVWKDRRHPDKTIAQTVGARFAGDGQLMRAKLNHLPMTTQEAENLMDYNVYVRTGSLCESRAAAARTLRRYAHHFHNNSRENHRHACFKELRKLKQPKCDAAGAKSMGVSIETQLGRADGR